MGSKFSVDNEFNNYYGDCSEYMTQPKSTSLTSTDSDERALSKVALFLSADEQELLISADEQELLISADEQTPSNPNINEVTQRQQNPLIHSTEIEQFEELGSTDKLDKTSASVLTSEQESETVKVVASEEDVELSFRHDEPHLPEDIHPEKITSVDYALLTPSSFPIHREGGDVQGQGPYSASEFRDFFLADKFLNLLSDFNAPMNNNDGSLANKISSTPKLDEILEYVGGCEVSASSTKCLEQESTPSDLEGTSSEDGESVYNGVPTTDVEYETDCLPLQKLSISNPMQDLSHSYFEFSYEEQMIPRHPPNSPVFSESYSNRSAGVLSVGNPAKELTEDAPKIQNSLAESDTLLSRAKQAFRPITPFVDSTADPTPSRKMDSLHTYLMHVEKRQIEMSKAWSLIRSCDMNKEQLEASDVQDLISNCKKFKQELTLRVDWLLDEVSTLQCQLQKLNSSTDETNNQKIVTDLFFKSPENSSISTSLNELLQLETLKFPDTQEDKQPNSGENENTEKPSSSVNEVLKKVCDDKQEEYLLSLKAYIDHDFDSYKNGRYNIPDQNFRTRHTNAKLLFGKQRLGDFYFHFLS